MSLYYAPFVRTAEEAIPGLQTVINNYLFPTYEMASCGMPVDLLDKYTEKLHKDAHWIYNHLLERERVTVFVGDKNYSKDDFECIKWAVCHCTAFGTNQECHQIVEQIFSQIC